MKDLHWQKSLLIVEAERLKALGSERGARAVYAEAADLEERLTRHLRTQGDPEFYINAISAASCWLQAERHGRGAQILRALLDGELPPMVRTEIEQMLESVRQRQQPTYGIRLLMASPSNVACSYPDSTDGRGARSAVPHWRGRSGMAVAWAG